MKIAIIGGGLAGTACAYVLKRAGLEPVIYEAGQTLASGASGNAVGLYNPRFTAEYSPEAEYFDQAFGLALQTFSELSDIDWEPCGALHLITDEKKERRFSKMAKSWGWDEEAMRLVDAGQASEIAGVSLTHDALYLSQSGSVSPKKLCAAYAQDIETHLNLEVLALEAVKADAIVLACGPAVKAFAPSLPVKPVRGQVSYIKAHKESEKLRCHLCYGGYTSKAFDGRHVVGSTFQRWLEHTETLPGDDADNLSKLEKVAPSLVKGAEVIDRRAALRTTAPDHFPIVGGLDDKVYVSTAHGSHGILSSLIAAHEIAALIQGRGSFVSERVQKILGPARFLAHPL